MTLELLKGTLAWSAVLSMGILLCCFFFSPWPKTGSTRCTASFTMFKESNLMPSIMPGWRSTKFVFLPFLSCLTWLFGL